MVANGSAINSSNQDGNHIMKKLTFWQKASPSRHLTPLALLALAGLAAMGAHQALANEAKQKYAGYEVIDFKLPHYQQSLQAALWYPVGGKTYKGLVADNALFVGVKAYVGAAIEQKKYPLVLISHGSGGSKDSMAWLASKLAIKGAMVMAFNHPGSSTGDSSPRRSVRHWTRPKDISAALDALLENFEFGPLIDQDRIAAAGFSLGGATALSLAGAKADLGLYQDYCKKWAEQAQDCIFFKKGGVKFDLISKADFSQSLKDPRISRSIAIDPGLTYGFTQESIKAIKQPIMVISLGDEKSRFQAANVTQSGSGLMQNLQKGEHIELAPASHFTALPICKPGGVQLLEEEEDDPICTDPAGTDRADIHRQIAEAIARFLDLPANK